MKSPNFSWIQKSKNSNQFKPTFSNVIICEASISCIRSALKFGKTFRKVIVCYFAYATMSISSLLLVTINSHKTLNQRTNVFFFMQCINGSRSLAVIQPTVCLNVVMMWLLIYCNFGDQVTTQFGGIDSKLYLCNWYNLPIELEKNIPMMLLSVQKPIYLRGFGSTSCTRETFKKVCVFFPWFFSST